MAKSRLWMIAGALAGLAVATPGMARSSAHPAVASSVDSIGAITRALADPARSDANRKLDAERHPDQVLSFVGVGPGQDVADWGAGSGYYSELFADLVGKRGHIYATFNPAYAKQPVIDALVASHPNIFPLIQPPVAATFAPHSLDLLFAHLEFHDLFLPASHGGTTAKLDVPAVLAGWFAAIRPGGHVVIVDHVGPAGPTPTVLADTRHRIDPEVVKSVFLAAGFVLEAESSILHRSDDDFTKAVFDPAVRGKTDRFALKFRRPG